MNENIIFISGAYGVGKSTIANKISNHRKIICVNASDLIAQKNNEDYQELKEVNNKEDNQKILIEEVNKLSKRNSEIILTGHFCIFGKNKPVERLPEYVFEKLGIKKIIVLKSSVENIEENLENRGNDKDNFKRNLELQDEEIRYSKIISSKINKPVYIHNMKYDESDLVLINRFIDQ